MLKIFRAGDVIDNMTRESIESENQIKLTSDLHRMVGNEGLAVRFAEKAMFRVNLAERFGKIGLNGGANKPQ